MNNENEFCVYIHTNLINNKKYIGQTCLSPEKRWNGNGGGYLHKKKNGDYSQPAIARAILKYGWENFSHEIIQENLTKEEADALEKELIQQYKTNDPQFGYNIREGGGNGHLSEATKQKLKEGIGDKYTGEKNPFYGKKHTEESKQKMREWHSKHYPDIKGEKNPMYGHVYTEEELERKRQAALGKKHSPETKAKMSELASPYLYECVETGEIYGNTRLAEEATGIKRGCIAAATNGRSETAGGFHWKRYPKNKEVLRESTGKIDESLNESMITSS